MICKNKILIPVHLPHEIFAYNTFFVHTQQQH